MTTGGGTPPVSVVVPTRDRPGLLAACLDALGAALRPGDELVVVDSDSTESAEEIADLARRAGAHLVRSPRRGASLARNLGARAASHDLVAFTDDDCLVSPEWVSTISADFARRASLGFLTGRVVSDQPAGPGVSIQDDDEPRDLLPGDDPMGFGHGANTACRRSAFLAVGGFDERLGAGGPLHAAEDKDLYWRLLRAGWRGAYVPTAVVVHRQWRTRREVVALRFRYGVGSGAFAVKAWRVEGAAGRRLLTGRLGRHGLRRVAELAWARDLTGVASELLRLAGTGVGALRGATVPLAGDRFT